MESNHQPADYKSAALPIEPRRHSNQHIQITLQLSGTNRTRTYDPLLVRQMLSQLSYDPILTTPAGLEPATSAVTGRRSNQLSHEAIFSFLVDHRGLEPRTDRL